MKELTLRIVTPTGALPPVSCHSVHLNVCDNTDGKGGGSYGIRPGHIASLFALGDGSLKAFVEDECVFSACCRQGFVTVDQDAVTVVTEQCVVETE